MKISNLHFGIVFAKQWIVLAAAFLGTTIAFAVPAHPGIDVVRQPDGTEVRIRMRGDKWCHWHEDEAGYTVMREPTSKAWVYADLDGQGKIMPTALRVGKADPSRSLTKGLRAKKPLSNAGKMRAASLLQAQPDRPEKTSARGTLRNLVVLVQFPNLKFRYAKSDFEALYNQTGYSAEGAYGSVKDYYFEVSYGQLNLESVVVGPVTVSGNYAMYGENASDSSAVKDMVAEALALVERQGFDFSQCDMDGDGQVDGLDIIHAGYGAEYGSNSQDYIWSHKWQLRSAVTYDGVRLSSYHTEPEIYGWESNPSGNKITPIGTICHETGHFLGLPDLYDLDSSSAGAGNFCIMAGGCWNGGGRRPAHMSAWCKAKLGWVTPTVISATGDYTLPRIEDNRKIYKLQGDFSSQSEYFLIENRQGYGFDASLPGSNRGILIWHIDEAQTGNSDESHYKVDLEEASGSQELELNTSSGNDNDYWRSTTKTEFSASTTPDTSSYAGEVLGISLSAFSASGDTMSFHATMAGEPEVPLEKALDNMALMLTTGGASAWYGQEEQTHDGVDAARSGTLGHSQQNWMQTTVTGPGTVSFWWCVSSEANYDFLEFLVDGVSKMSTSGTTGGWTSKSFTITSAGTHTLQWRYKKDGSVSKGLDAGFVDQVAWTRGNIPANDDFAAATVIGGTSGSVTGTNVGAGAEEGEPLQLGFNSAATVWWKWTAPTDGSFTFTTQGSDFDTVLGAYTGKDIGSLGNVATNDDSFEDRISAITFDAVRGATYYIAVGGYSNNMGSIVLSWTIEDVVVNVGDGKRITVPGSWLEACGTLYEKYGGDKASYANSRAVNGRKVWECYVMGLDPEKSDDFKIVSFPMNADGTPDLENIEFTPSRGEWNVPEARPVVKGAATPGGEWQTVTKQNKAAFRFFKVVVELP